MSPWVFLEMWLPNHRFFAMLLPGLLGTGLPPVSSAPGSMMVHDVPWWSWHFNRSFQIHSFFFLAGNSHHIHHLGFIKESSAARCWSRLMSHAGNRLVLLCTLQSPSPIHCSALMRGWKVHLCFHIHYVTMSTEGKHKIIKYWHFTIQMVHELHQIPKSSRICRLHLAHLKLRVANNNKVTTSGQSASQIQTCKAWPALPSTSYHNNLWHLWHLWHLRSGRFPACSEYMLLILRRPYIPPRPTGPTGSTGPSPLSRVDQCSVAWADWGTRGTRHGGHWTKPQQQMNLMIIWKM